jgi:hypothetical protein
MVAWRSVVRVLTIGAAVGLALGVRMVGYLAPAGAQAIPKSLEEGGTDSDVKWRKNQWTVGVAGGLLSGSYMTFADELAQVLDDGDNLRVLPIVTYGAASNLEDLLYLKNVDVAVTQSDVFEFFRTQRKIANLDTRINYIIRLPISEMHVMAGNDIKSLADLRGKKVNFGPAGSASSLTGAIVFQRAGVQVEGTQFDNPTQVPPGQSIDTIAVPSVLAVFNWPKNTDRYRRVQRFVEALYTKWDKFLQPPRHPKWRDVNLAATVPGWTRWAPAEEMLRKIRQDNNVGEPQQVASSEFSAFMKIKATGGLTVSPEQRDALFAEFLQWQQKHGGKQR